MRETTLKRFNNNILAYRNRTGWILIPGIISSERSNISDLEAKAW